MPTGVEDAELALARRAAALCGMTRLADITRLDRVRVPVYQALRPLSRALSVHQGKGLTPRDAMLGALMEAVESHCAEAFVAPARLAAFQDLPPDQRAHDLSDFATDRPDSPRPDEPLTWVAASFVEAPGTLWVPQNVVSLDFSCRGDTRLDRSSNGLGCRFDLGGALTVALLELVERDALGDFLAWSPVRRSLARISFDIPPPPWLRSLRSRLEALNLILTVYAAPACIAASVLVCELLEPAAPEALRSRVYGAGCHPDPQVALKRAVLEAAQSRLTAISGARDDLLVEADRHGGFGIGFAPPPPPNAGVVWSALVDEASRWPAEPSEIARRLHRAGYGPCAYVELTPPTDGVFAVKAVAPGLGSMTRRRRPGRPAHG